MVTVIDFGCPSFIIGKSGMMDYIPVMILLLESLLPATTVGSLLPSTTVGSLLPATTVGSLLPAPTASDYMTFEEFMDEFNKTYENEEELWRRQTIFNDKVKRITEHNKGNHSYILGINQFSDLTHKEFVQGYTGANEPDDTHRNGRSNTIYYQPIDLGKEPSAKDYIKEYWTDHWKNPVRDQGQCGSCWAFGAVASIEMQFMLNPNETGFPHMSEQYLVDCVSTNNGCDGGWHDSVYNYVMKNGMILADSYPYRAEDGECSRDKMIYKEIHLVEWQQVDPVKDGHLKNALVHLGPMAVVIHASQNFHDYQGGVLDDPHCSDTKDKNHIVTLVGYGTEDDKDYWLLRNSHGIKWGENGYMKLSRNQKNHCRISEHAYIPIVKVY